MYSISHVVGLVKQLENETRLDITNLTRVIVGANEYFRSSYFEIMLDVEKDRHTFTGGAAWRELRDMVTHGLVGRENRLEVGVIEASGDVVAIGHVIAGIHAGFTGNLYGVTVAGNLAKVIANRQNRRRNGAVMMGGTGMWETSSCPPRYTLRNTIKPDQHVTRAELVGDIDGFIIGKRLPELLKDDPSLKLSHVLQGYYSEGFKLLSSKKRADQFKVLSGSEARLVYETQRVCERILIKAAASYEKTDYECCETGAGGAAADLYKTMQIPRGKYCAVVVFLKKTICTIVERNYLHNKFILMHTQQPSVLNNFLRNVIIK